MSFPGVYINGTNAIDGVRAREQSSAPDAPPTGESIAYPNATGLWMARNDGGVFFSMVGPGFEANASSNQTVVANVLTRVVLDVENWDSDGWFNTTNGEFKPQVAGRYWVYGWVTLAGAASGSNQLVIRKNTATDLPYAQAIIPSTQQLTLFVADLIDFNGTTDYVRLFAAAMTTNIIMTFNRGGFGAFLVKGV